MEEQQNTHSDHTAGSTIHLFEGSELGRQSSIHSQGARCADESSRCLDQAAGSETKASFVSYGQRSARIVDGWLAVSM